MSRWAIAIVLILVGTRAAFATEGLDVIVIVDRSGSLPAKVRASHRDSLLFLLDALARGQSSSRISHRFGVISFGSRARMEVALSDVLPGTISSLRQRVRGVDSAPLGHTNFIAPFEIAAAEFRRFGPDPRRRRLMILLTDGVGFVPGEREDESLVALRKLLASTFPDTALHVVLTGDSSKLRAWQEIATPSNVHRSSADAADLLATLHSLIVTAVGSRGTQTDLVRMSETLIVPPYLDLIVFDIFRGSAGRSVSILPPGATSPLTAAGEGVEEVGISSTLTTLIVRHPAAGVWTFRKSDPEARVRILSQEFFPRGWLLEPHDSAPLRRSEPVTLRYRLTDAEGQTLRELAGYPLSVDLSLMRPDGSRAHVAMARDALATFRSVAALRCDLTGRYWTEVHVATRDSSGRAVPVFDDQWSGFAVNPAASFQVVATRMPSRVRETSTTSASMVRPAREPLVRRTLFLFVIGGAIVLIALWWAFARVRR